jgi:hypothetical protein
MIHAISNISERLVQQRRLGMKRKVIGVVVFVGISLSVLVALVIAVCSG